MSGDAEFPLLKHEYLIIYNFENMPKWPALAQFLITESSQETKPHYRRLPEQMLQIITFTNMTTTGEKKPNTVIPRLTKIIRSGITFVSRNLR